MRQRILYIFNRVGLFCNRYLKACFKYDFSKFETYGGIDKSSVDIAAAKIRIISHTIEKAFSLSDCRDDFGKKKISDLITLYQNYRSDEFVDKDALEICKSIVHNYYIYRVSKCLDVSFIPAEFQSIQSVKSTGAKEFRIPLISEKFGQIADARHSIRNYDERKVDVKDIIEAVRIAQTAPSACNRQATRIYACLSAEKNKSIQDSHGGIRTFSRPGVIFAIAQDLSMYINEYERNTWLVDGGIFCMNMLYALQSVGIGACPVIWGGMEDEDNQIAMLLGIPKRERVVILIVGGYPPKGGCKTPCSAKRPVEDILHIIK